MRRAVMVVAAIFSMLIAGPGVAGATVGTDQPDYGPGSVVTISGDNSNGVGYVPGNRVEVFVAGPNAWTATCEATVVEEGTWSCQVTLDSDPEIAVGDYAYTATSTASDGSPITESGTFTDAATRFANPAVTPTSQAPGGPLTFTGNLQYYNSLFGWTGLVGYSARLFSFPGCTPNAQPPADGLLSSATTTSSGAFSIPWTAPSTEGSYTYALRFAGAGGGTYAATTACLNLTVNRLLPEFTFVLPTGFSKSVGNLDFSVAQYASKPSDHTQTVVFAEADGSVGCDVDAGGTVHITGPADGSNYCKITASLAADDKYIAPAPITQQFHIARPLIDTRVHSPAVAPASVTPGGSLTFTGALQQNILGAWIGLGSSTVKVQRYAEPACSTLVQDWVSSQLTPDSGAFSIPVTAPSVPGTYYYALRYAGANDGTWGQTTSACLTVTVTKIGTSVLYTGVQSAITDSSFNASATLAPSACAAGQTITFAVESAVKSGLTPITIPGTSTTAYIVGTATTGSDGKATTSVLTAGWSEYVGSIYTIFQGTDTCSVSYDEASLMVASAGGSAHGGGWEASSASNGRLNFGFTVSLVPGTGGTTGIAAQYKGQFVMVNNGAWRLKGTLNSYVQTATGVTGSSDGVGTLYRWVLLDPATNLYGWQKAADNVTFSIAFADNNSGGGKKTTSPDTFGIQIRHSASAIPNNKTDPSPLKGGDISIKTTK